MFEISLFSSFTAFSFSFFAITNIQLNVGTFAWNGIHTLIIENKVLIIILKIQENFFKNLKSYSLQCHVNTYVSYFNSNWDLFLCLLITLIIPDNIYIYLKILHNLFCTVLHNI